MPATRPHPVMRAAAVTRRQRPTDRRRPPSSSRPPRHARPHAGSGWNVLRRYVRLRLPRLCEVRGHHVSARRRVQRHVHGYEELRRGRLRYRNELPGRVQRRSVVQRGARHRDHHERDVHRQGRLQSRRLRGQYVHCAMQRQRLQGSGRELLREELQRERHAQRTVQHVSAPSERRAQRFVPGSRVPLSRASAST
jgi:hypothetical protein